MDPLYVSGDLLRDLGDEVAAKRQAGLRLSHTGMEGEVQDESIEWELSLRAPPKSLDTSDRFAKGSGRPPQCARGGAEELQEHSQIAEIPALGAVARPILASECDLPQRWRMCPATLLACEREQYTARALHARERTKQALTRQIRSTPDVPL